MGVFPSGVRYLRINGALFHIFRDNLRVRDVYTFYETLITGRGEFLMDLQKQNHPHLASSSQQPRRRAPQKLSGPTGSVKFD